MEMATARNRGDAGRPTQEAIAERAYQLFLQRGSVSGHEVDDWLQAEAELTAAAFTAASDDTQGSDAERGTPGEQPLPGRGDGRRGAGRDRTNGRRSLRP
jgi:hypothetical protein